MLAVEYPYWNGNEIIKKLQEIQKKLMLHTHYQVLNGKKFVNIALNRFGAINLLTCAQNIVVKIKSGSTNVNQIFVADVKEI